MDYLIEFLYAKFLQSKGVCIDTRKLKEGQLFFSIKGDNFDGNQYAADAIKKGALFAIVDDPDYLIDGHSVLVENSVNVLQELAKFHRGHLRCPVIGITGSNGKTTTKELVRNILEQQYIVACTLGNLNNHLGVPLTVLEINPQHEVAVVEMGASAVGEIALLCQIARPTMGLITNIGKAHTETFGGIEGVLRGKSELFDFIKKNQGKVFINREDPFLTNMIKRFDAPVLYPSEDLEFGSADPYVNYRVNGQSINTTMIGAYNFINMAAATALGKELEIEEEKIHAAISAYIPDNNRSEIVNTESNLIIKDAYNANPDSMRASIENFSAMEGSKIAILGDMNELENPEEEHRSLGELVDSLSLGEVIFCGKWMEHAHQACPNSKYFINTSSLASQIKQLVPQGAKVLLKASRGLRFETLFEKLK